MKKMKRLALTLSCGGALLVSCSGKKNSNIESTSYSVRHGKINRLADILGLPRTEDEPDLSDPVAVAEALATPPKNFLPTSPGYQKVFQAAAQFVVSQEDDFQNVKVVKIEPLKLPAADTAEQTSPNFISIPYVARGDYGSSSSAQDLSGIKSTSGLREDGYFEVYKTKNGGIDKQSPTSKGSVYLVTYSLKKKPNDKAQTTYQALMTVPKENEHPEQVMIYAHGGDSGLAFSELATTLQDQLGARVVIAPIYPGEPVCAVSSAQGTLADHFTRHCTDHEGRAVPPAIEPLGAKSPLKEDVQAFLGAANLYSKVLCIESIDNNPLKGFPCQQMTNTIAVGASRGGSTLIASLSHVGIGNAYKLMSNSSADITTLNQTTISAAAFYYAPSSFTVGPFRVLTQYMLTGVVPEDTLALPMAPELLHYFDAYRNAAPDSQEEADSLQTLVGFIAARDIVFGAPYLSVAVQNWQTKLTNGKTAPGSLLFLHGTQDKIVPYSESLISKTSLDQVFQGVYSDPSNMLSTNGILPVGSHFVAFQPDETYYNSPSGQGRCKKDQTGQWPSSYNPEKGACFAGGVDHGTDGSFLTSHAMNSTLATYSDSHREDVKDYFLFGAYLYDETGHIIYNDLKKPANQIKRIFSTAWSAPNNCVQNPSHAYCLLPISASDPYFALFNHGLQDQGDISNLETIQHMVTGTWDPSSQSNPFSPNDAFDAWIQAIQDPSFGVFKPY